MNSRKEQMKIALTSQGDLLQARVLGIGLQSKPGGGRRGVVTSFSPASRKRMLQLVATIVNTRALFLTFTYGQKFPTFLETKRDLDVFAKRLVRKFPRAAVLWRVERQKRGAPHIHMLVWNVDFISYAMCRRWWLEIIDREYADWSTGKPKCPQFDCQVLNGTKRVMYYVSKYCAKNEDQLLGLSMSHISPQDIEVTGRHWGIIGRKYLPLAEKDLEILAYSDELWKIIKWCASGIHKPIAEYPKLDGFTLFVHDANGFVANLTAL